MDHTAHQQAVEEINHFTEKINDVAYEAEVRYRTYNVYQFIQMLLMKTMRISYNSIPHTNFM